MPCQAHLGEVRSFKAEFDRREIRIAVVSFAEPAKLIQYQRQRQWPFMMLADPQRKAYAAFALKRLSWFHVYSLTTLKLYFKLLGEGMTREDYGKDDMYQGGGDFLLDRAGNVLFAQRSQDPADRPSAEKLLHEFDRLGIEPPI
ncbi:MAG: AhpC/TSA family protein [Candidatus Binatia bacterium]